MEKGPDIVVLIRSVLTTGEGIHNAISALCRPARKNPLAFARFAHKWRWSHREKGLVAVSVTVPTESTLPAVCPTAGRVVTAARPAWLV
jgi:hypothetical protein